MQHVTEIAVTAFGIYLWLDASIKLLNTSTTLSTPRRSPCPILTCIPSHAYRFGHCTGSGQVFSQRESGSSDMSAVIRLFQSQRQSTILLAGSFTPRALLLETLPRRSWQYFYRLGVPYHAWRITHAKHHASSGHMTQDQVFVPPTRSELGLRPFDPSKEDLLGARVISEVKKEMWEALGDSPIGAALQSASYLVSFHTHNFTIDKVIKAFIFYIYSSAAGLPTSSQTLLVKGGIQRAPLVSLQKY